MPNEISTIDQAAGRPALASLALSLHRWTIDAAIAAAGPDPLDAITAAAARLDGDLVPVPTDPEYRARWKAALDERLRRLAVKIAPGMPPAQTEPWRDVMADALSDLPAMVALTAAKRAIHRPMNYLNEVEGIVREIAKTVVLERKIARARLDDLARELSRPTQPALPPQADGAPLSIDEIRKMPAHLREMGVSGGWISQEEIDAAGPPPEMVPIASRRAAPPRPAPIEATLQQYLDLSLSPGDAAKAVEDHRRMLSRSPAKAIGTALPTIGEAA